MPSRGEARILARIRARWPQFALDLRGSLALVACVCALLAGCSPSGEDPISTLSVVEAPGGEYRVRYLEPPWELISTAGTTAYLRIQSNAMTFGGPEAGLAKYELTVTVEPGDVASRLSAERSAAQARGEEIVGGPRAIAARTEGVAGHELLTRGDSILGARNHRYVFFPLSGARVVRLAFDATPSLDTPEVDAMIAATDIGPEGS